MTAQRIPSVLTSTLAILCALSLLQAQQPEQPNPTALLSPEQLDNLVAPIALYPDPLISQILVASTYPLELVQAYQWLQQNPNLNGPDLTQAAQQQNWDPSVQALAIFPDLIKRLNQDITWTQNLGNAFLAQQGDVMDAVQRMRQQAQQAGKLASTTQQQVITTNDGGRPVIEIEPANPQVIYVPEYDPAWIWGPPVYYPYPRWYYPPRPAGGIFFGFGGGISIGAYFGGGWGGWGGWGWRPGWGSRTVIVNNNFIHRYNFNTTHVTNLNGSSAWSHDSLHRQGVPYSNRTLSNQYGAGVRGNLRSPSAPGQVRNAPAPAPREQQQGQFRGAQGGGFRQPQGGAVAPADRIGARQVAPPSDLNRNRSAFGGIENGTAARVHSDHGYSSLGPARSGGSAPREAPAPRSSDRGGGGGGRRR